MINSIQLPCKFYKLFGTLLVIIALFCRGVVTGRADELSLGAVEQLFLRHSDDNWKMLAERWETTKSKMVNPIENLALPLDYYPDGRVKARLIAERSQIFQDGTIFATGVRVIMYDVNGQESGHLRASDCIFEKENSHGYCSGAVEVQYGDDIIKGVGMYFSIAGEYIKILSNCVIKTRRFETNLGRLL